MAQKLILFDFDGTLTTKDSMLEFVRFLRGDFRLYAGYAVLGPLLAGFKLGLFSNEKAKRAFLRYHLSNVPQSILKRRAEAFAREVIPGFLRPEGMAALERYRAEGHRVVLVSASLDIWLEPWARMNGLELLCTQADWTTEGKFSGQFATPNCQGPEKVRRLKEAIDIAEYETVVAYGDSSGDKEMLALAAESHYKPFRND